MAIFTRRSLQRMLNENAAFLSREQLRAHVDSLNAQGVDPERYLSYEWEVAVLNAFSQIGRVQHEPDLSGQRFPDLHFSEMNVPALLARVRSISAEANQMVDEAIAKEAAESRGEEDDGDEKFAFVADIATVSDTGLHERNPIEALVEEFGRIIEKKKLRFRSFSYTVGRNSSQEFILRKRSKLKLPPRGRFGPAIFNTPEFKDFLNAVQREPEVSRQVVFNNEETDLTLGYDPRQRGFHGGGPVYRSVSTDDPDPREDNPFDRNLKHNGVWRALKSKADQLKGSGFAGRKGIIICDGGSQLLRDRGKMMTRTAPEVIAKFLRESNTVDFVVSIAVDYVDPPRKPGGFFTASLMGSSWADRVPQVQMLVDANPRLGETQEGRDFAARLVTIALAGHLGFPKPVTGAEGALRWMKSQRASMGRSGISMERKHMRDHVGEISFSARELLEVLAGKKDLKAFLQNYGLAPSDDPEDFRQTLSNPFETNLNAGCLIREASVERLDDRDDDRITFKFGRPDPAVAPFEMPPKPNQE